MMLLLMIMIMMMMGTNELWMYFYAVSGKVRVLNEGESKLFVALKKMNSFELCKDSEVYSRYAIRRITLWTFCFCSRQGITYE